MGEMADYALEQLSVVEYDSHGEGRDGFDDLIYEEENDCFIGPCRTLSKTCRYCGQRGLMWGRHNDSWRLFDGGNVHICRQYYNYRHWGIL